MVPHFVDWWDLVNVPSVPEFFQVGDSIRVAGENDLSRIATLRNMMRNIQNDHARQSGHEVKIAERVQSAASECLGWYLGFPEWERIIGVLSVCPQISPSPDFPPHATSDCSCE